MGETAPAKGTSCAARASALLLPGRDSGGSKKVCFMKRHSVTQRVENHEGRFRSRRRTVAETRLWIQNVSNKTLAKSGVPFEAPLNTTVSGYSVILRWVEFVDDFRPQSGSRPALFARQGYSWRNGILATVPAGFVETVSAHQPPDQAVIPKINPTLQTDFFGTGMVVHQPGGETVE